jgi:hypothetical protein
MERDMTYAAHPNDFHSFADQETGFPRAAVAKKPGILRRLFQAFTASRRRAADREIERFLARSGGRFTDDLERDLMQRVATGNWNVHR